MKNNKKHLLKFCIAIGLTLAGWLQVFGQTQEEVKYDTIRVEDQNKYRVVTNGFWDNWFLGAGAGVHSEFDDHNKQMKFTETLTPSFSFYVGKSFSPVIGTRIGFSGFEIKGVTQDNHSTGVPYSGKPWIGYWLFNQRFNYYHIHSDVLFNFSNLFGGYKEARFYEISPYLGGGLMVTNDKPAAQELSSSLGIFNTFRLGKALNLTLDIRSSLVSDRFDGDDGGRSFEGGLAALVGLQFKLNKRNWDKPAKIAVLQRNNDKELAALRSEGDKLRSESDKLRNEGDRLRKEIELLRKQLAEAGDSTVTKVKVERDILAAPLLVTFLINKSTVSNEARVNLGYFARVIKKADPAVVYLVTGYADKETGTPRINERLSRARAKAIYNVLVNEFGVSKNQLKIDYKGGVENMFYHDPRLSRAVITIADEK